MSTVTGRAEKLRFAGRLLFSLVATLTLDYLCTSLARSNSGVALLWLPDALLLGLQLGDHAARQRSYLAIRAGAGCVAHLLYGDPVTVSFASAAGGALQLGLAGSWLRDRADTLRRLAEPTGLRHFLVSGVILPPLIAGGAVAVVLLIAVPAMSLASALAFWRNWALAGATGTAIVMPLVLVVRGGAWQEHILGDRGRGNIASLLACGAMISAVFAGSRYPLLFLPIPLMLLVTTRMSLFGAAMVVSASGTLGGIFTLSGFGPFAQTGFSPIERALLMQAFVAAATLTTVPIALVAAARRRADHGMLENSTRLARSEHLFRLLAEHSSDVVMRSGIDGRRRYISPSVLRIIGYTQAEMMAPDWIDPVHPDDLAGVRRSCQILATGIEPPPNLFRYRHKDGVYRWFESRITLVRGASGAPVEFISNIRDITTQKSAEDALAGANATLLELSETDGLTGVANRRRFDAVLQAELQRGARSGTPTALLMIDADHFKAYNDMFGHQAGDQALVAIASCISASVRRAGDCGARYGGEEFAMLLPGMSTGDAEKFAERIRVQVEGLPSKGAAITVSIGVASVIPVGVLSVADFIGAADAALYEAKAMGRNQTRVANLSSKLLLVA